MPTNPKFSATLFGAVRRLATDPNGTQRCVIEAASLVGAGYKNFKVEVTVAGARSEDETRRQVKESVTLELARRFPAETWRERDVLLYGF